MGDLQHILRGVQGEGKGGNLWQRKRKVRKAKAVDMTEEEQEIILDHLLDGD